MSNLHATYKWHGNLVHASKRCRPLFTDIAFIKHWGHSYKIYSQESNLMFWIYLWLRSFACYLQRFVVIVDCSLLLFFNNAPWRSLISLLHTLTNVFAVLKLSSSLPLLIYYYEYYLLLFLYLYLSLAYFAFFFWYYHVLILLCSCPHSGVVHWNIKQIKRNILYK